MANWQVISRRRKSTPDKIINIASLLQTLCYFVSLALQHAESQKKLSYLSYHDNSTTFIIVIVILKILKNFLIWILHWELFI